MSLRFHWMFPKGGEVGMKTAQETSRVLTTKSRSPAALPDMQGWVRFAREAEQAGIESVLLSFSRYEPDTFFIACAVGQATTRLKFIAAYRLGLMQPAAFVQQINTLSGLIGGRVALNVVAGSSPLEQRGYGDFLDHDERFVVACGVWFARQRRFRAGGSGLAENPHRAGRLVHEHLSGRRAFRLLRVFHERRDGDGQTR